MPCISCEEEEGEGNKEILYESLIVNEYLAESFTAGTESLLPSSPFLRAKMRLVIDYLDSTLNKAFFAYFANSDEEKETALKESFDVSLDGMEKIMADGGTYMCGDSFTLADVSCLPFFERMAATLPHFKGYTFNKQRHPKIVAWMDRTFERKSFNNVKLDEADIVKGYEKMRARFSEMQKK